EHRRARPDALQDRRLLRRRGRHRGHGAHVLARAHHDRLSGRRRGRPRRRDVSSDLPSGHVDEVVSAFNVGGPLRGFAWARLGVAVVPLALGPFVSPGLVAGEREVLALALVVALASSGALLLFGPPAQPRRLAWFICLLDAALITAVVAATGGARSIFAFLYVLCVTSACVLLSRTRGLAIAAVSSVLYTGIVVGRTVLPLSMFFDAPPGATTLEMLTMFLNAVTFL